MIWPQIFIVSALILLNGFFAMSELALFSSRRGRLQQYALNGKKGANIALKLLEDPTGFLSTVQVGITLIAILSGAYGEATLAEPFSQVLKEMPYISTHANTISSAVVIVSIAYVSLMAGELIPKRLALRDPERFACFIARPMQVLAQIAHPVIWVLRKSTELIMRLMATPSPADPQVTEEEVKALIREGAKTGVFKQTEREMLEGVLHIADRTVRTIMTPRPNIAWLDMNDTLETNYETIQKSGHSRFPIARDDVANIVGVVHTKDLFDQFRSTGKIDLKAATRDPVYIHETMPILKLLELFKEAKGHIAVVLDEHGTVQGLATPTDILVAITGELPELQDDEEPSAVQRTDGSWLLDGQMPVHDVERTLAVKGLSAFEHEYTTLAGFVLSQLGHIPVPGEAFDWQGWRFEVVDLDGRRIDKVLASAISQHPLALG